MLDSLGDVAGSGYGAAILWTLAALVLLLIVLIIVKMVRNLTFGTFVAGGRNRKTRLAVMDATAVDSHRRLVLIRRDDIEHLLLIGGPTDVVVERDIRLAAPRRPNLTTDGGPAQPGVAAGRSPSAAHAPQHPAQPARQVPHSQPAALPPRTPTVATPRPAAPAERATPAIAPTAPKPAIAPHSDTRKLPLAGSDLIDDSLAGELAVSLGETHASTAAQKAGHASLDDEMTKLLGELSSAKR
ncbi:flagellar biosynthetic protein FliO [Mesorhizobium sp. Root157]|uniref:flagellar biosynthetic protein FliO n=1 Tax=Mesorhizobium sp. Root157 TaxID=1736477 RepID=UPI001FCD5A45|nr:flagellar biosynthetic protein FliO [Mesorhizobium sp. Root157]